ncbi:MAG: hypothetical protein QM770_02580 [Tepidisphaeraceae bacterium]
MHMKRMLAAAVLAMGLTAVSPTWGQTTEPTTGSGTATVERADPNEQIAADAGLTGKDLEAFHVAIEAGKKKLADWETGENGQKLAQLRKDAAAARKAKDAEKVKSVNEEMRPLIKEQADLRLQVRGEALKLLTPEQQTKAVQANLYRRVTRSMALIELTAEQQEKVHALTDPAGAEYAKAHPLDQDPQMRSLIGVQSTLVKKVRAEILTQEQRDAIEKKK